MKPKGFGYVEFENSDDLRKALDLSGTDVGGRTVRISVAEAPKGREGRADEEISWTRQGPLAPLAGRSGGFGNRDGGGGGFDRPRDNGFGGGERADPEGARMGFGSKFVASVDSPRRGGGGFDRSASGGSSYDRAGAGGEGEDRGERAGFGSRFVPAAPVSERPPFGGDRRVSGPGEGRSDAESSWSRSGPLAPLPSTGGRNGGSFGDRAASGGFGDRSASGSYGDRSCE